LTKLLLIEQIEAQADGSREEVEQIEEKIQEDKMLVKEGKEEVARLEVGDMV